jgi:hypothetical protein
MDSVKTKQDECVEISNTYGTKWCFWEDDSMSMSFDHTGNGIFVSSSLVCLLAPAVAADSMPTSSAKFCSSLFICPESANMGKFPMDTSGQILPKSQLFIQTKVKTVGCPQQSCKTENLFGSS